MRTYTEIFEDIRKNKDDINSVKEEIERVETQEKSFINSQCANLKERIKKKRYNAEFAEQIRKFDVQLAHCYHTLETLEIKEKILINNCKVAVFHEITPVFLDILKRYNGKRYGEKTQNKITNELKDKTGFYGYISHGYSEQMHISCINDNSPIYHLEIDCGGKHENGEQKTILNDNVINTLDFSDIKLFYINSNYVDDIDQTISALYDLHGKIKAMQESYNSLVDDYNDIAVDGIRHIDRCYSDIPSII